MPGYVMKVSAERKELHEDGGVKALNWRDYICTEVSVSALRNRGKGVNLSTNFILQLLAAGWTTDQILQNYPQLRSEHLRAVFAFAAEFLKDDYYLKF